jgi:hypothetical protein
LASVSLRKFLQKYPKVAVKRDPTKPGPRAFTS